MSFYQPSISEADLSFFDRNFEDAFECIIHPVKLSDVSEELHGLSILESFAKDNQSAAVYEEKPACRRHLFPYDMSLWK